MLLIVKPSENTEFGAEIFANVQNQRRREMLQVRHLFVRLSKGDPTLERFSIALGTLEG